MEKTYFSAYYERFEFPTKKDLSWSKTDILDAYNRLSSREPVLVGKFNTREEAVEALMDKFGIPLHCASREQRGSIGWLLTGELSYVSEEIWEVSDDGDEDFDQECGWTDIYVKPFDGEIETEKTKMTIEEIIKASGGSMAEISRRFEIPYRTIQDWVAGRRKPPEYVLRLLATALEKD